MLMLLKKMLVIQICSLLANLW
jgi:hypothetical protein